MLEITLTREGFKINQTISDDLLSSGSLVKVVCEEPYYKAEDALMEKVCECINSSNQSGTKVRPNISLDSNGGTNSTGHYIKNLTFQIII